MQQHHQPLVVIHVAKAVVSFVQPVSCSCAIFTRRTLMIFTDLGLGAGPSYIRTSLLGSKLFREYVFRYGCVAESPVSICGLTFRKLFQSMRFRSSPRFCCCLMPVAQPAFHPKIEIPVIGNYTKPLAAMYHPVRSTHFQLR